MSWFEPFGGWVKSTVKSTVKKVSDSIGGGIEYVDKFYDHLKDELSNVLSYFKKSSSSIIDSANSAWHKSVDAVKKPDGIFDTAISKAQSMSTAAVDKLDNMTDFVTALTNWTIGFAIGLMQGFSSTLKYGIEKGFSPLQGVFHAAAAGSYEAGRRFFAIPGDFFNSFWSDVNNVSASFGPFGPLFTATVIFVMVATMIWIAKVVPPWFVERIAERG